jgi:hypothetical protein
MRIGRIDSCLQRNVPLWKINPPSPTLKCMVGIFMYWTLRIFSMIQYISFSEWDVVLLAGGEEIDKQSRHHTKNAGSEFESAL